MAVGTSWDDCPIVLWFLCVRGERTRDINTAYRTPAGAEKTILPTRSTILPALPTARAPYTFSAYHQQLFLYRHLNARTELDGRHSRLWLENLTRMWRGSRLAFTVFQTHD